MNIKINAEAETKTLMNISFFIGFTLGGLIGVMVGVLFQLVLR